MEGKVTDGDGIESSYHLKPFLLYAPLQNTKSSVKKEKFDKLLLPYENIQMILKVRFRHFLMPYLESQGFKEKIQN